MPPGILAEGGSRKYNVKQDYVLAQHALSRYINIREA